MASLALKNMCPNKYDTLVTLLVLKVISRKKNGLNFRTAIYFIMHAALCVKENNDKNVCGSIRFVCCFLGVRQWTVYLDFACITKYGAVRKFGPRTLEMA